MFLHIDINSYFAAILQQENPFLRGKPIGVLKSAGRSCVIAASKEAKKFGVKTGMGIYDCRKLCPTIITVPAEFDFYLDTTKRLKKIFESITPDAEIFSLDEAFIPLDNCKYLYPNPIKLAEQIQERIKTELGTVVTCNVGIAENRLLAKIAGEIAPKGTITVVDDSNKEQILRTVKFADVCGIGYRLEERLKAFGVYHPYDINKISDVALECSFGSFLAKELRKIGKGEGSYILDRVDESEHMKSVGRTITGYRLCNNENEIKMVLYNLMDEVTYKVRKMDMAGRHVSIFLIGEDKAWSRHKTVKYYIRHTSEMFDILYNDFYKNFKRDFKIIRYGVGLSLLTPICEMQPTLFPSWYKNDQLYKAIDKISDKYGLFTLHSALLTQKEIIRPEVTGFLGDKKYQFMENK